MAANVHEDVDQLQDLEAPSKMPRPWTALRRGPNFKEDKYTDSLPPITAARFRRQRRARAVNTELDQGPRKPMKVTRHFSLRQPGDASANRRDLDVQNLEDLQGHQDFSSPRLRPQSPAMQAGEAIANMAQTNMTMHKAIQLQDQANRSANATSKVPQSNKSIKSQYESDSDFIGSSESSTTHEVATEAIDEFCSNSAKLTSEIMDMIRRTSTESVRPGVLQNQRPRAVLRRSASLNDRSGSARRKIASQLSVPAEIHNVTELPKSLKSPRSTTSRPHSAWTECSKVSRPISGRHKNGGVQNGQSGSGLHVARDSNLYEHEYINNDHLDGWSDDEDSDWSSGGSCEGLDSGYDNDIDDIELVSTKTKIRGQASRNSLIKDNIENPVPKILTKDATTSKAEIDTMDDSNAQQKCHEQETQLATPTTPATSRSRSQSRNTPQPRSRSNPPASNTNLSPSQSSIRVEDWLITCREQKIKPLTCLPDITAKSSPR